VPHDPARRRWEVAAIVKRAVSKPSAWRAGTAAPITTARRHRKWLYGEPRCGGQKLPCWAARRNAGPILPGGTIHLHVVRGTYRFLCALISWLASATELTHWLLAGVATPRGRCRGTVVGASGLSAAPNLVRTSVRESVGIPDRAPAEASCHPPDLGFFDSFGDSG